jgi:hypothetical protein
MSTIEQWLGQQLVPLYLIGFALLMGLAIVFLSAQHRRATLKRSRSGRTEDTFVAELAAQGFDPLLARAAYVYLHTHQRAPFPLEPLDDLERDLGFDPEDIDQTVRELLQQTGRAHFPGLLSSPIVTVQDLVRFLQASPRRDRMVA